MAMRMSARGAVSVASKAKKLRNFGKAWNVGDKGIVLYPLFYNDATNDIDLLVAAVWGYKVNDMNAIGLKASFIPSNAQIDENGEPVTPDVTSQFSKIASAFVAGEKEGKTRQLEGKTWPSQQALKSALENLNKEFDAKNNPKAKKAVISRLQLYISTEVVYIPLDKENKPMWDEAGVYSQALSNERINKLYAIINDPKFGINKDSKYLEVQYDFIAADGQKSTAGKCQPVGQPIEYLLKSRYPDAASKFDQLAAMLPDNSDIIMNHNYSYRKISESSLRSAFSTYAITNGEFLDTLPEDMKETVIKSSQIIQELSILPTMKDADLKASIEAELSKNAPVAAPIMASTPAVENGAPNIQDLMNNPARPDAVNQEELDEVNLD